jgi:ABC-type transport system substrate-binding protein
VSGNILFELRDEGAQIEIVHNPCLRRLVASAGATGWPAICHSRGKNNYRRNRERRLSMITNTARVARTALVSLLLALLAAAAPAEAGGTLRIAMTASDVPTTTGAPDNGFEGLRFFGYPVYEGLVLWDLTRADRLAEIRPGLAESWEQDKTDMSKWIFHLRHGVKFHDGSDFNADAVIWNFDRYFKPDVPQTDPTGGAFARARTRGSLAIARSTTTRSKSATHAR